MTGVPLLTDNHVRGPLIKALRERGWDVARAEEILSKPGAFVYPIEYMKPRRMPA